MDGATYTTIVVNSNMVNRHIINLVHPPFIGGFSIYIASLYNRGTQGGE